MGLLFSLVLMIIKRMDRRLDLIGIHVHLIGFQFIQANIAASDVSVQNGTDMCLMKSERLRGFCRPDILRMASPDRDFPL